MKSIKSRILVIFTLFLITGVECVFAQRGNWAIKTGIYSSRQRQQNILTIPDSADSTASRIGSNRTGGYGRATYNLMVGYDLSLSPRIAMQLGLGYRQKGFRSEAKYLQDKGYALFLPSRITEDNLFHYASSELSFQFRTAPRRTVGYLRLGQRLDYLLGFKSAFWGDNYGYLTQFEYNVFGGVGVEYALRKKWFNDHVAKESNLPVISRPTVFFIELEGTPLLFNISKTRLPSVPLAALTDPDGNQIATPLMRVEKIVRNTGFGVTMGVRF